MLQDCIVEGQEHSPEALLEQNLLAIVSRFLFIYFKGLMMVM